MLQEFQPIERVAQNPMTLPRELSNVDKHRIVHPTVVRVGDIAPVLTPNGHATISETWYAEGEQLEVGTLLAWADYNRTGPYPNINMETLPVRLHFGSAPDRGLGTVEDVVKDIIERCAENFF